MGRRGVDGPRPCRRRPSGAARTARPLRLRPPTVVPVDGPRPGAHRPARRPERHHRHGLVVVDLRRRLPGLPVRRRHGRGPVRRAGPGGGPAGPDVDRHRLGRRRVRHRLRPRGPRRPRGGLGDDAVDDRSDRGGRQAPRARAPAGVRGPEVPPAPRRPLPRPGERGHRRRPGRGRVREPPRIRVGASADGVGTPLGRAPPRLRGRVCRGGDLAGGLAARADGDGGRRRRLPDRRRHPLVPRRRHHLLPRDAALVHLVAGPDPRPGDRPGSVRGRVRPRARRPPLPAGPPRCPGADPPGADRHLPAAVASPAQAVGLRPDTGGRGARRRVVDGPGSGPWSPAPAPAAAAWSPAPAPLPAATYGTFPPGAAPTTAPPGWYAIGGDPGLQGWWTGAGWASVHRWDGNRWART